MVPAFKVFEGSEPRDHRRSLLDLECQSEVVVFQSIVQLVLGDDVYRAIAYTMCMCPLCVASFRMLSDLVSPSPMDSDAKRVVLFLNISLDLWLIYGTSHISY